MKKHLIIICSLACLIGFFGVLLGCDQPAEKPATPKVIRKKIHAKTVKKTVAPESKAVTKAQPAPKAEPAATQTDSGKQAPQQPLIAQKTEPAPVETSKPKPPVKPKSDISMARVPGSETVSGQAETSSASPTAVAKSSSTMPPMYNPKGKVDPFEPLFKEKQTVALIKKERKKRTPRTPLEKIDISQLKLVGIILASSGNKALVEESSGKGYVIKKGTYMGTNSGKVVEIEKDKVIISEEYEDVLGNVTLRNKELKLPKPPGEL